MEKLGVQVYVVKKMTTDLLLHPIPIAIKCDHLSDLKLADSDFRTPARIDLLLGAEVFGKIKGSDAVDVANMTLE